MIQFSDIKKMPSSFKAGLIIVLTAVIIAIFAPVIAPYDPYEMGNIYEKPGFNHLLGTNEIGRAHV